MSSAPLSERMPHELDLRDTSNPSDTHTPESAGEKPGYEPPPRNDNEAPTEPSPTMTNLLNLPNETLHNVFISLDPQDLARVSRTCKVLDAFVKSDGSLFREVYCRAVDGPLSISKGRTFNYEQETKDFVKLRHLLTGSRPAEERLDQLPFIASVVSTLLRNAQPDSHLTIPFLTTYFSANPHRYQNTSDTFLTQSTTFSRAAIHPDADPTLETPFAIRQASAKLHVLYGNPVLLPHRRKFHRPYPFAVSMVYDLRNYKDETLWGPYLPDLKASVDWEKVEAVMLVIGYNLAEFRRSVGDASIPAGFVWKPEDGGWKGATPGSYVPKSFKTIGSDEEEVEEVEEELEFEGESVERPLRIEDPYGIHGTYMRVVCFLDFHDLFAYNFTSPSLPLSIPRPPLTTTEAIRLITMEIRTTHTSLPGPDDGQDLPVVHFEGVSRSLSSRWDVNANSAIKGSVRLTREGEVRWQTISVYNGEERWRSEGIQVGGVRSARGVFGHWFDKDHDIHGPAGPTAFYKLSDTIRTHGTASSSASSDNNDLDIVPDDDEGENVEVGDEQGNGGVIGIIDGLPGLEVLMNDALWQEVLHQTGGGGVHFSVGAQGGVGMLFNFGGAGVVAGQGEGSGERDASLQPDGSPGHEPYEET